MRFNWRSAWLAGMLLLVPPGSAFAGSGAQPIVPSGALSQPAVSKAKAAAKKPGTPAGALRVAPTSPPLLKVPIKPALKRQAPGGPGGKPLLPSHGLGGERHLLGGDAPPSLHGGVSVPVHGSVQTHRLALTFDHVGDGYGNRVWQVAPGDEVNVFLKVTNTGGYPETIFVMAGNGDRSGSLTVAAGSSASVRVQKHVIQSEFHDRRSWIPRFTLFQADSDSRDYNSLFRDVSPRDNAVVLPPEILKGSPDDVAVVAIRDVRLGMAVVGPTYGSPEVPEALPTIPWISDHTWRGTGYYKATTLQMTIGVQSHTSEATSPRKLTVKLNGIRSYMDLTLQRSAHFPRRYSHSFGCSGQFCPVQKRVDLPSIENFGATEVEVSFSNLPYTLWVNERGGGGGARHDYHGVSASGYYSCSNNVGQEAGSQIAIQAEVQAGSHERLTENNGLRRRATFGHWRGEGCGTIDPGDVEAYTPRQ